MKSIPIFSFWKMNLIHSTGMLFVNENGKYKNEPYPPIGGFTFR